MSNQAATDESTPPETATTIVLGGDAAACAEQLEAAGIGDDADDDSDDDNNDDDDVDDEDTTPVIGSAVDLSLRNPIRENNRVIIGGQPPAGGRKGSVAVRCAEASSLVFATQPLEGSCIGSAKRTNE